MSEVEKRLKDIASKVNANEKVKASLEKWVDTYNGKVILFRVKGDKSHSISFTSAEAWVEEGEYPSPDLIFEGEEKILLSILSKEKVSFSKAMRSGELMAYGNLHEAYPFGEIIKSFT